MPYQLIPASLENEGWLEPLSSNATFGAWDEARHARQFSECLNRSGISIIEVDDALGAGCKVAKTFTLIEIFAAAVGTVVIPVIGAVLGVAEGPGEIAGRPDNAPYRAAIMMLVLTPVLLVFASAYWAVVLRAGLSVRSVLLANVAMSACVAFSFTLGGWVKFGFQDAVISFWMFGAASMTTLGCGTLFWSLVRRLTSGSNHPAVRS